MTLKVLQITDCHFVRPEQEVLGVGTAASLTSVLAQALAEGVPDAVVVSGDVGHECAEADYRLFHKMLTDYVDAPTLCLPGNHDVLAAMEAAELPLEPLELGSWQIVVLDSHEDLLPEASISPMKMAVVAAAKAGSAARHGHVSVGDDDSNGNIELLIVGTPAHMAGDIGRQITIGIPQTNFCILC